MRLYVYSVQCVSTYAYNFPFFLTQTTLWTINTMIIKIIYCIYIGRIMTRRCKVCNVGFAHTSWISAFFNPRYCIYNIHYFWNNVRFFFTSKLCTKWWKKDLRYGKNHRYNVTYVCGVHCNMTLIYSCNRAEWILVTISISLINTQTNTSFVSLQLPRWLILFDGKFVLSCRNLWNIKRPNHA